MLKVLVNAYAVRPNSGSEAGAAWHWITGFSKRYELFIITEGEWKEEIEKALPYLENSSRIHFYYNPITPEVRRMCWNQGDYRFYYYYAKWQMKTLAIAREIVANNQIDIIHQLNMIGFREPGNLWKIPGIPFVWGPIGGMNQVPMQYLEEAPVMVKLKYWLKNIVSSWQFKYHPRVQKAIRRSDVMIAANNVSYEMLQNYHPEKRVELINETGSLSPQTCNREKREDNKFRILWVGRFIPTKLLDMSLEVIKELQHLDGLEFHVVGQAFNEAETIRYHDKATKMRLDNICHWHGWVSHDEVQSLMMTSDVFFFPSVVEGTPHVVLEAIANRLPIVCFDACGQAEAVNEKVGFKIPLTNPKQSIADFTAILTKLSKDKDILKDMRKNCELRAKELSWERKVEKVSSIYEELVINKPEITPPTTACKE